MTINEINIIEFGCLKNKVLHFEDGMNIIFGENESGKSTVMLFIKFMLYGLGKRSSSNCDRERSISWSGHTAAGSMVFCHGESVYRIERRYTDGGKSDKLSVICLDSGETVSCPKSPGEYFLGVPREVFESSSCVGQMRSTYVDGEKTAQSMQNMLTAADEGMDTAKILKLLDATRVKYLHKNQNGGSLYESRQNLTAMKESFRQASEAKLSLDEHIKKAERTKADYQVVKRELELKDTVVAEMNKVELIKRFESLEREEQELAELEKKQDELKSERLNTEYFPDRAHIAELKVAAKTLGDSNALLEKRRAELAEQERSGYDRELARLGEELEKKGGADAVLASVNARKKKYDTQKGIIAAVWVMAVVLSAVGAMLIALKLFWGAAFFASIITAMLCTASSIKIKKQLLAEIRAIAAEYGVEPEGLTARLEAAGKALAIYRAYVKLYARLEAELESAEHKAREAEDMLRALLIKTAPGAEPTVSFAQSEAERLNGFINDWDSSTGTQKALALKINNERVALSQYNEQELREGITLDVAEITPMALAEAQKERRFLSSKKDALERRMIDESNKLAELRAYSRDPLAIADELYAAQAEYARDKSFYDALVLAMETLEAAGKAMSGSVTPVIARRASEIMGRISGNKYTALRTTGELAVSLDSEGFSIKSEYLSGGTRDAAYLSLRLALWSRIYGTELPPLMLDEALCQLDEKRTAAMLELLCEMSREIQCLCFTSHKRELFICEESGAKYNLIVI